MSGEFRRWVHLQPSSRDDNGRARHPFYGLRMLWYLQGPAGVVQFMLCFNHEGVAEPWDVGYHSPTETESGTRMVECDHFDGGCWYDGTSLFAEEVWAQAVVRGDDAIWSALEDCYRDWLGPLPASSETSA